MVQNHNNAANILPARHPQAVHGPRAMKYEKDVCSLRLNNNWLNFAPFGPQIGTGQAGEPGHGANHAPRAASTPVQELMHMHCPRN